MPQPLTKIHQVRYVKASLGDDGPADTLAMSTEDGRIVFYSTNNISAPNPDSKDIEVSISNCYPLCQLGGKPAGLTARIKDFEILFVPSPASSSAKFLVVAACSDGSIRLWTIAQEELNPGSSSINPPPNDDTRNQSETKADGAAVGKKSPAVTREAGLLIGTYETGNRITCLKAFLMSGAPEDSFAEAEVGSDHGLDGASSDESESP